MTARECALYVACTIHSCHGLLGLAGSCEIQELVLGCKHRICRIDAGRTRRKQTVIRKKLFTTARTNAQPSRIPVLFALPSSPHASMTDNEKKKCTNVDEQVIGWRAENCIAGTLPNVTRELLRAHDIRRKGIIRRTLF